MQPALEERFHAALDLYNRGEYLAAQEMLERVHEETDSLERPVVYALAILATAMHLHFRRGGGRGVVNLLRQFLLAVEERPDETLGVDLVELAEAVEAYLGDLQERRKPGAGFFDRWLVPKVSYGKTC
jgi:predicted metal-dependent hydrolase